MDRSRLVVKYYGARAFLETRMETLGRPDAVCFHYGAVTCAAGFSGFV